MIHLKRFSFRNVLWKDKLDFFVDFPLSGLDMGPHVRSLGSKTTYDLYGVINHHGFMMGGHYTAYSKSPEDDKWYKFDDARVTEVTESTVAAEKDAYILLYRLRDST